MLLIATAILKRDKSKISFCIIVDVSYANTYTDVMISVCRQEDVESIKEEKDAQGIK